MPEKEKRAASVFFLGFQCQSVSYLCSVAKKAQLSRVEFGAALCWREVFLNELPRLVRSERLLTTIDFSRGALALLMDVSDFPSGKRWTTIFESDVPKAKRFLRLRLHCCSFARRSEWLKQKIVHCLGGKSRGVFGIMFIRLRV